MNRERNEQKNFFFNFLVPSENKKDVRSIEQTMADIQAKKRLKLTHHPTTNNSLELNESK